MALTDKSAIPLSVHDLRMVEGAACFLDRRLNLRLGYGRDTYVRRLIKRLRADFEARWGTLRQSDAKSQGGRPAKDFWLTKGQALWVCRKSDAKNADDVMEEVIKVFLAVDAGAPIPNTPCTDALFAPERAIVERDETNIIAVKWEQPPLAFDEPGSVNYDADYTEADCIRQPYDKEKHEAWAKAARAEAEMQDDRIIHDSLVYDYKWIAEHNGTIFDLIIRVWRESNMPFLVSIKQSGKSNFGADRKARYGKVLVCADRFLPIEIIDNALTRWQLESKFSSNELADIRRWLCHDRTTSPQRSERLANSTSGDAATLAQAKRPDAALCFKL
jgi:hypothetical protein